MSDFELPASRFMVYNKNGMNRGTRKAGFTLIELLIYVAIFSVLAVVFSSVILVYFRINVEQIARSEITSQFNFVLQTIQRMIGEAGTAVVRTDIDAGGDWDEIDSALGEPRNYLVLKNKNEGNEPADANSPTVVYAENGVIKIRRGRGAEQTETALTTGKVAADNLSFKKLTNYPGREIIEINLILSYNSANPLQQVSRRLISGVGKAEAAIFDTSLLPGVSGGADIGQGTQRWRDGYFSGNVNVDNQTNTGALVVGGGTIINNIRSGFLAVDPPAIAANGNGTFRIASSAIGASDRIFLTPPPDLEAGLALIGASAIDATDEIEITLRNTTASAINGAPKNWAYLLLK